MNGQTFDNILQLADAFKASQKLAKEELEECRPILNRALDLWDNLLCIKAEKSHAKSRVHNMHKFLQADQVIKCKFWGKDESSTFVDGFDGQNMEQVRLWVHVGDCVADALLFGCRTTKQPSYRVIYGFSPHFILHLKESLLSHPPMLFYIALANARGSYAHQAPLPFRLAYDKWSDAIENEKLPPPPLPLTKTQKKNLKRREKARAEKANANSGADGDDTDKEPQDTKLSYIQQQEGAYNWALIEIKYQAVMKIADFPIKCVRYENPALERDTGVHKPALMFKEVVDNEMVWLVKTGLKGWLIEYIKRSFDVFQYDF